MPISLLRDFDVTLLAVKTEVTNASLPYFFGYKTEFFFFQNNTKDLDPSCKMDLDHLGLFRKGKIGIIANFHHTDLVIEVILEGQKPRLIAG